jgi:hypothetical protein
MTTRCGHIMVSYMISQYASSEVRTDTSSSLKNTVCGSSRDNKILVYIEIFYNRRRWHAKLDNILLAAHERKFNKLNQAA